MKFFFLVKVEVLGDGDVLNYVVKIYLENLVN